jgi:uncharacterized protein YdeI (YjbR/CyaY-like superfamily)
LWVNQRKLLVLYEVFTGSNPASRTIFPVERSPRRQGGYILDFSVAKQSKTRVSRVEKCMEQILNEKGLNDQ